jgi:hypothetical protein
MVKVLVDDFAKKLNVFAAKNGISQYYSPHMILHQQNLDYDKHCQYAFGTYVQAYEEPDPSNTNAPHTLDCIYLQYNDNKQGGHNILNLQTNHMITPILITPVIIKMVHRIAKKDGMPKGLKITNHTGKVLYDSTWIAGVDYDEDEFKDEDYDSNSDEDEDSKDSNDDNFAYISFSVLVGLSVLTMSFPAPCADSAHLPGRLTCHAVLLSLLKKSRKVLVTLFPRFPPPWPSHTIAAQSF